MCFTELCRLGAYQLAGSSCDTSFGDGVCDATCDNEHLLFDGFDCVDSGLHSAKSSDASVKILPHSTVNYCGLINGRGGRSRLASSSSHMTTGSATPASMTEVKCRRSFADGVCDNECDNAPCLWDGGDCMSKALRYCSLAKLSLSVTFSFSTFKFH